MHILIVGCGRVGAELALSVSGKGHDVAIVDHRSEAFDQLGSEFHGRTLQGSGIDRAVLLRAGIENADAFAAVTSSDNINIVAARVAREIYKVPIVVARAYSPHRLGLYERFGLQTIASSSWGAQRFEELITSPQCASRLSLGNGDVEIVEVRVPAAWVGRPLDDLTRWPLKVRAVPLAVTRGGRAQLVEADLVLQAGDLLHLAVQAEDLPRVSQAVSVEAG
jgi:trk system potassium uptake protein TrkA